MTRTTAAILAIVVGAVVVGAVIVAPRFAVPSKPNVIVIVWDTVRADRMSLYGHDRPTTPNLEAFARDAAVYERAISPGEWTIPSHGSLFTGLPVAAHGANNSWLWLDGHHLTMAEHFGANGYRTFAWSSNPQLGEHTNMLQGFGTVKFSYDPDLIERCTEETKRKLLPQDKSTEISPAWVPPEGFVDWNRMVPKEAAPVAADVLLDWIDRSGDQPFFAFVNLIEAHVPRVPSVEARKAVGADDATIARQLDVDNTLFRVMAAVEGKASISAEERALLASIYDATLWEVDRGTAKLFEGLRARGILDDTIVVVTSDHGENLGDHGMYEHRWDLHDSLVHVPLVVRYPPKVHPGRVAEPVSTQHLYGTLVELTGLPEPAVSHPLPALGEDDRVFAELALPGVRDPLIRRNFPDLDPDLWKRRYQAVYEGNLKLLRTMPGRDQLFDVVADPRERSDLSGYRPQDLDRLRKALEEWRISRPSYDPSLRSPEDKPRKPAPVTGVKEMLQQLGYTDGDEPEGAEAPKPAPPAKAKGFKGPKAKGQKAEAAP